MFFLLQDGASITIIIITITIKQYTAYSSYLQCRVCVSCHLEQDLGMQCISLSSSQSYSNISWHCIVTKLRGDQVCAHAVHMHGYGLSQRISLAMSYMYIMEP